MKYIEESIETRVSSKVIWDAWSQNYLNKDNALNKSGYVKAENGKGVKYSIAEVKENQSFTIIWYSLFVKLVFTHSVQPINNGSIISCRVSFKGFMSFLVRRLLQNKIKKYLLESLKNFAKQLESR